jgi:hypothetical protein
MVCVVALGIAHAVSDFRGHADLHALAIQLQKAEAAYHTVTVVKSVLNSIAYFITNTIS